MSSRLIVIGASHSGLQALCSLVAQLPANFPAPVFVVQHTGRMGRLMHEAHQVQKWSTGMLQGSGIEPPVTASGAAGGAGI